MVGNVLNYLVLAGFDRRSYKKGLCGPFFIPVNEEMRCNVYDLSTIKRPDIRTVRERGEMRKREQGVKRFRPVEVVGRE